VEITAALAADLAIPTRLSTSPMRISHPRFVTSSWMLARRCVPTWGLRLLPATPKSRQVELMGIHTACTANSLLGML